MSTLARLLRCVRSTTVGVTILLGGLWSVWSHDAAPAQTIHALSNHRCTPDQVVATSAQGVDAVSVWWCTSEWTQVRTMTPAGWLALREGLMRLGWQLTWEDTDGPYTRQQLVRPEAAP